MSVAAKLRAHLTTLGLPALPSPQRIEAWDRAVDDFLMIEGVMRKKKPKGSPRARNLLFDALALATGTRDLSRLTRNAAKAIGVALADIAEVCPDLTVEEIERVVKAYKQKWPDPRNLSAPAVAKHWDKFSEMSQGAKTRSALNDPYQEPADWVPAAAILYGLDIAQQMKNKGWFEFGTDVRKEIMKEIQRLAAK